MKREKTLYADEPPHRRVAWELTQVAVVAVAAVAMPFVLIGALLHRSKERRA